MAIVVAVASGKGGVGKTTTVVNLGLYAARNGIRTAIVDVDPLSDIAELLDLPHDLLNDIPSEIDPDKGLDPYTLKVFEGLHLLFPLAKIRRGESGTLFELLKDALPGELGDEYDLILLDMPAGADEEENLSFLSLAERIVVVTNPEPAAHVAAGNYLATLENTDPGLFLQENPVYLWHNRYNGVETAAFRPGDVIGNYNRNMPEDRRLDPSAFQLEHIAFVPDDSSLDLLRGGVAVNLQLLRNLVSSLDALHDSILSSIPLDMELSSHFRMLLRFFLRNRNEHEESSELLESFATYLRTIFGITSDKEVVSGAGANIGDSTPVFTPEQAEALKTYFIRCNENRTRLQLLKARSLVEKKLEAAEQDSSLFGAPQTNAKDPGNAVDRELSALLMFLEEEVKELHEVKNHAGLILFYFSLYKLLQSDSVRDTLDEFVPKRDENGQKVRDRHRQIMRLVEKSEDYRNTYLSLIRRLFPLIMRQVEVMSSTFELKSLIFRNNGKPAKEAYAKLTSNFVHEVINSGLGVIVSFSHRPASRAFEKGAEALVNE